MNLERKHNRVNREALWNVLKIYGVGGQLMEGIKAFCSKANACVKVDTEFGDSFAIGVGAKQGCVMSPWLFNIFMDGCMRGMKAKVGKIDARLKLNGGDWLVAACLFVDDTVLLADSEGELQKVVDQLHSVCSRRKLRANAVIGLERKEAEVADFGNP